MLIWLQSVATIKNLTWIDIIIPTALTQYIPYLIFHQGIHSMITKAIFIELCNFYSQLNQNELISWMINHSWTVCILLMFYHIYWPLSSSFGYVGVIHILFSLIILHIPFGNGIRLNVGEEFCCFIDGGKLNFSY